MRVNAPKGQKVRYLDEHGYESDLITARRYLVKDNEYTVEKTDVGSWRTSVYLQEYPDIPFNSVHFEELEPLGEETSAIEDAYRERYMRKWD